MNLIQPIRTAFCAAALISATLSPLALAESPPADMPFVPSAGGRNARLPLAEGKEIYSHICQGCHMADGRGGSLSPAAYPALASNAKLAAKVYPALVVINGQGAMPAFGTLLSDEQIAAAVNYVRTTFSNTYADSIASGEVRSLRPAGQTAPTELRGR